MSAGGDEATGAEVDRETEAAARKALGQSLRRLGHRVRLGFAIVLAAFGLSLVVVARRQAQYAGLRMAGEVWWSTVWNLLEIAIGIAVLWVAIPLAVRWVYDTLVEEGRLVPVEIVSGPAPRFGGPLGALLRVLGRVLPTAVVSYRTRGEGGVSHTGAFFPDERLPPGEPMALVDPARPHKAWLVRERRGAS